MGDWNILINGVGSCHNGLPEADVDLAVREFVSKLRGMNQTVTSATFSHGEAVEDINPSQPTGKQVLAAVAAGLSSRLFHRLKREGKLGGQFDWNKTEIGNDTRHALRASGRVGFYATTWVDGEHFGVSMDFVDTQIYLGDMTEALYQMTKTLKDTLSSPGREPSHASAEEALAATEKFFSYIPKAPSC